MWTEVTLKQILLITDGCSNVGTDPVYVAQTAREQGVTVSVIGILDDGALGEQGQREAENIAQAGGGMCRIIRAADLSHTMQMVTQRTMQLTLQQVVNKELRQIMGQDQTALPPDLRTKVARMVETGTEEVELQIALVVDVSASMTSKMASVREAIRDLEFGLAARGGSHRLVVVTYPGVSGEDAQMLRMEGESVADAVGAMRTAGNTPTGPALQLAVRALRELSGNTSTTSAVRKADDEEGRMRHYVV
ncbi:VWA domain-containing protein [Sulfoacidibacillus thermotolerans]|uniref:VWFA domain-containing protein n=1 Tax=Sulfoacidibacillus thermotolerans TaxID=1765684 RepID=A0A2U3DAZ6_SULT2|nr:VWA domain-containing protein [Sulfoacidibacillus thermotolerans]PWI58458.1 hypothetical protein BM613_02710 [Sulfoacidibacillus thermotolerans]